MNVETFLYQVASSLYQLVDHLLASSVSILHVFYMYVVLTKMIDRS